MVAMLAFGGTYAYFTASANSKSATVTTGTVQMTSGEAVSATVTDAVTYTKILDGVSFSAGATDVDSFFFVKVTVSEGVTLTDLFASDISGMVKEGWLPLDGEDGVYYQAYSDSFSADFIGELKITKGANWAEGADEDATEDAKPAIMGITFSITIAGRAIQALGENGQSMDAATAYTHVTW